MTLGSMNMEDETRRGVTGDTRRVGDLGCLQVLTVFAVKFLVLVQLETARLRNYTKVC